jgi:hypothetical protein
MALGWMSRVQFLAGTVLFSSRQQTIFLWSKAAWVQSLTLTFMNMNICIRLFISILTMDLPYRLLI